MSNIYELDVTAANNASVAGMNWAEGQTPGTVNNSARQLSALIAQFLDDIGGDLEAGGTANALTLAASSDFTTYADGRIVSFKATATNTAATTLSVNGIGAKAIRKMTSAGEAAIDAGDITNGYTYVVRYSETANSAAGAWLLDWAPKPAAINTNLYVPVGAVTDFAGTSAPSGWLLCYGQAISRTTYSALFTAISTTYGVGDGSTTFNVPDARGRVSAGKDDMGGASANRLTNQSGGLDGDTLGATGGAETHTLTEAQLAAHTHAAGTLAAVSGGAHTHTIAKATGGTGSASAVEEFTNASGTISTNSGGAHTHTISGSTASSGSGTAHNNVQPTIIFNKIIFTGV